MDDSKAPPMGDAEKASCVLYICAAGHLQTKNDESWSGKCDDPKCREVPVVQRKAEQTTLYEQFFADRKAVELDYERRRTEPLDAKEEPVLDADTAAADADIVRGEPGKP